jgi:hypothetical protein
MNDQTTDRILDKAQGEISDALYALTSSLDTIPKTNPDTTTCLDYCRRARASLINAIILLEALELASPPKPK